jgi:predicted nucleic acid-binding protein
LFDNVMQMSYIDFMILFDASTLILLAKIDMLDIFIADFAKKVAISDKVRDEVLEGLSPDAPLIARLIEERGIDVLKAKDKKLVRKLMEDFNIDEGEAETLILAIEKKASLVATDDKNAIKACKMMKLDFATAIAILVRACERNLIQADEALAKLQNLQSFARYKKIIIETARNQIEGVAKYGKKDDKHTNG